MADTLWASAFGTSPNGNDMFRQSGEFSSVLKDSLNSIGTTGSGGISFDGTDSLTDKRSGSLPSFTEALISYSGCFTSTVKASQPVTSPSGIVDITCDPSNTGWLSGFLTGANLKLTSGRFTSTIKTSNFTGPSGSYSAGHVSGGLSFDGQNTPLNNNSGKFFLQSGQYASVVKTSVSSGVGAFTSGVSWNGTDTPASRQTAWALFGTRKHDLHLWSGQFTSVLKTSQSVQSVMGNLVAGHIGQVETHDFAGRQNAPGAGGGVIPVIAYSHRRRRV